MPPPRELNTGYIGEIVFSEKMVESYFNLDNCVNRSGSFMYFRGSTDIPPFVPLPIIGNIGGHVGGHKIQTKMIKIFFPFNRTPKGTLIQVWRLTFLKKGFFLSHSIFM